MHTANSSSNSNSIRSRARLGSAVNRAKALLRRILQTRVRIRTPFSAARGSGPSRTASSSSNSNSIRSRARLRPVAYRKFEFEFEFELHSRPREAQARRVGQTRVRIRTPFSAARGTGPGAYRKSRVRIPERTQYISVPHEAGRDVQPCRSARAAADRVARASVVKRKFFGTLVSTRDGTDGTGSCTWPLATLLHKPRRDAEGSDAARRGA